MYEKVLPLAATTVSGMNTDEENPYVYLLLPASDHASEDNVSTGPDTYKDDFCVSYGICAIFRPISVTSF